MKIFSKSFWGVFWGQSSLKLLWHVVSLFTLKTCLKMITGRLRPVIKLLLGFGFDFGNENQITCTRSNQHAFGNVLLAYDNGLLLCLEKMLGTNRIKLGLGWKKVVWVAVFCCHDSWNSLSEWLLARASVTGHEHARASSRASKTSTLCLHSPPTRQGELWELRFWILISKLGF